MKVKMFKEVEGLDLQKGLEVKAYIDTLTKPPGSLGRLEELAVQLGEITRVSFPKVTPPGIIVFAADHGVAKEGVSAFPQEVTQQMVYNFVNGGAAINVFAEQIGAQFSICDIGVAAPIESNQVVDENVRRGTGNFAKEDAMTKVEAEKALRVGYRLAEEMIHEQGIQCLILGEMGIGNTTTSSAILAVLSEKPVSELIGIGTGIESDKLKLKQKVIEDAIQARNPDKNDPLDILAKVGGLEIAGMAGAMLAAAANRIPILVDGFICTVAALIANELDGEAKDYMIVGHKSVEPGHETAINMLGKLPLLDLGMRLGEGSGAAVAFPILQSASLMLKNMATFDSAGISNKE